MDLGMNSNSLLVQAINLFGEANSWPAICCLIWQKRKKSGGGRSGEYVRWRVNQIGIDVIFRMKDFHLCIGELSIWSTNFCFWLIATWKSARFPIGIKTWLIKRAPSRNIVAEKVINNMDFLCVLEDCKHDFGNIGESSRDFRGICVKGK
jgi:hypothetical protein